MGLVKKLGKAVAPFVLAGSMFLGGCDNYQPPAPNPKTEVIDAFPSQNIPKMQRELSGKKLALALIPTRDHNKALDGIEKTLEEDFLDVPNYTLYTARTENLEEIFNNLRDYSKLKPIDALILAYHGSQNNMSVNFLESINSSNVKRLFHDYSPVFSEDAIIMLYSCSTGKGNNNVATDLSNVLNRDVVAPRYIFGSENILEPSERIGEFKLGEDGRVTYDFDHYKLFDQIIYRGKAYSNPLATSGHEKPKERVIGNNGKDYFLFIDK